MSDNEYEELISIDDLCSIPAASIKGTVKKQL